MINKSTQIKHKPHKRTEVEFSPQHIFQSANIVDTFIGGQSFLPVLVVALGEYPGATDEGRGSSGALSQFGFPLCPGANLGPRILLRKAMQ